MFVDKNGMEYGPGDLFQTIRQAAIDWGYYYNGESILMRRELGSEIYEVKEMTEKHLDILILKPQEEQNTV